MGATRKGYAILAAARSWILIISSFLAECSGDVMFVFLNNGGNAENRNPADEERVVCVIVLLKSLAG